MTKSTPFSNEIDLNKTDDAIALLAWLDKQPEADTPANHKLPNVAYGIPPEDTLLRAVAGLLTIHEHREQHHAAIELIRRLLQKSDVDNDRLSLLLNELQNHEQRQRQISEQRLDLFDAIKLEAAYSPPVILPILPYFAPRITTDNDHGVVFAVEIVAVQALRVPPAMDTACGDMLIALHHAANHVADRHGLGVDLRFAWRFISQQQSLSIAVIVHVSGLPDATIAEQAAAELWYTVDSVLPLNRTVFTYRPVTDPQRLEWICQPEKITHAFAIMRQEQQFKYEGRSIYGISPLGADEGNHHAMLAEMLRQPGTSVIDVQIIPTHWRQDERDTVREMLDTHWHGRHSGPPDSTETLLQRLDDSRYLRVLESYLRSLDRDLMFIVRVTVASTTPMAATSLPMVTALSLFGTSRYEIRPANLPEALEAASHLLHLNDTAWPRTNAPEGLERLIHLWTPDETLAAARLPVPGPSGLPGLAVQQIKITSLPPKLPKDGLLIGDAYEPILNQVQPIYFGMEERARHAYIVGRTGTGKTTLLENMALQDIYAGRGVGVVDPHGDLIEAILARIPAERAKDVVLFNPASAERPVGLNILDVEGDFEKNMVISEFMGLLYSIYDPGRTGIIGPRFEQAVRNAMHVAMAVEGSTLIDVMRILSNTRYARDCLKFVHDPMVKAYYKDILEGQSDFHRSEVLDYITSKFGRFTGDTAIRNVIGQSKTTIDFGRIMDDEKILLVNLSKGHIGQENSHFLGLLLVPRILIAAFSRAKQSAKQRKPFYLYIDEFQNFTTPMLSTMLSEGRKYGLSLTLANQFISQLTDRVREAIFGNIGTLGVFQVGVKDAGLLAQELYPIFDEDDLVNFPTFHMAVKMPLGGASGRPFMVKTRPSATNESLELAEAIRDYALLHYGRDAYVIDAEIRQRFNTSPQPRSS
jgi:hypothetical protein